MTPEEIAKYGKPLNKYAHCVSTDTHRRCYCCCNWLTYDAFTIDRKNCKGRNNVCKKCQKLKRDGNYKGPRTTRIEELSKSLPDEYGKLLPGCSTITATHKRCHTCKKWLKHSKFHKAVSSVGGLKGECKECTHKRCSIKHLSSYGLTPEDYDKLLASQNGVCAICGAKEALNGYKLYVDHDHATGKVRGLLCHHCNIALGALRDNPTLLRKAAKYIETRS